MVSFALCASVACLVFILCVIIEFYWRFYKLSDIPGPFCFPLITHIAKTFVIEDLSDVVDILKGYKRIYGEFYKSWIGPNLFFYVTKPEYLRVILHHPNCLEKGSDYRFVRKYLRNSFGSSPVDMWTAQRKMINPTFSQSLFTSQLSIVNKSAETLVEILQQNPEQSCILGDVTNCNLDIISEIMFQFRLDAVKNNEKVCHAIEELNKIAVLRMAKFWLQPEFLFRFSELHDEMRHYSKVLEDFAQKVFNGEKSSSGNEFQDKHFFPHLLRRHLNNELTKEDFIDHIKVVVLGGTETAAVTICFALLHLAMHQEIQDKIYKEITEIVGNREITVEDLRNLKYTECVIKETFRLTPAAPVFVRKTTDDIDLGKHTIPKNSEIFISIMDLHRDEKYWPEPLKFDPDRFLPENSSKIYPYSYLPFSAGPRNCIGQKQGMISTKVILAHLVRCFKVNTTYKSAEEIILLPHVVTKPKNGFKISLEKRV